MNYNVGDKVFVIRFIESTFGDECFYDAQEHTVIKVRENTLDVENTYLKLRFISCKAVYKTEEEARKVLAQVKEKYKKIRELEREIHSLIFEG